MSGQLRAVVTPGVAKLNADADGMIAGRNYTVTAVVNVQSQVVSEGTPYNAGSPPNVTTISIDGGILTFSAHQQISAQEGDSASVQFKIVDVSTRQAVVNQNPAAQPIPARTSTDF